MLLKDLYAKWKPMFWMVMAFMLFQGFFMYKGIQSVPFFLFNMYSTRIAGSDTSPVYTVYLNGKLFPVDRLSGRERETLLGSFSYYQKLKDNNFHATDSLTISQRFNG